MAPPVPVCLVDRYDGVRAALAEQLEANGAATVVAQAGGVAQARAAPGDVLVVGPQLTDGSAADLLDDGRPVVAYTWLPPDEREADLAGAVAVVHLDMAVGIAEALRPSPPRRIRVRRPRERLSALRAFHLSLPVVDLEAAASFYAEVLGCERRRTGPGWADLDFFGNQLSLHEVGGYTPEPHRSTVDGTQVPARHLGVVLDPGEWSALAARIEAAGVEFLLTPRSRFVGQPGEQHTFFVTDPSGNAVECKAFPDGVWT